MNPDDEANCFLEYSEKRGEIARIQQSIAKTLDRYKKLGVDTAAVRYAYTQAQNDDVTETHRSRTAALIRLKIIEFDETGQGSFMAGLKGMEMKPEIVRKLSLGRARVDGYNSGFAGGVPDANPHEPGTEEHVHWLENFHLGHKDRIEADPSLADVTVATPRKRRASR